MWKTWHFTSRICSTIHKYTMDQNSTCSRDKNSFIQGKPIKVSHRRLAPEGRKVQEKLEWPIAARFSMCACSLTHTNTVCRHHREWAPFEQDGHLPGVRRNTKEIMENYIVTFKFINISIWWLLASFFLFSIIKKLSTLFRHAIPKLLLPFRPAPLGKGFKCETLEQHSFARMFLATSTSSKCTTSFKLW